MLANKDNETAETIKATTNELQQASLKLFEIAYKKVSFTRCLRSEVSKNSVCFGLELLELLLLECGNVQMMKF